MHSEDLISVIIPVYNAEGYLERCLRSVCNQTYQNLEIICVNDGSTDATKQILSDFSAVDSRIKVLEQENHGEGHARNQGLAIASGQWLCFVDNDDWLEAEMYEELLMVGHRESAELVCGSWFKETANASIVAENKLPVQYGVFGRDDLLAYIYRRDDYQGFAYMWDKLYRRELMQGLRFDEGLRIGGDVLALAEIALRVRRAVYLDKPFYHYLQRDGSGCHTDNVVSLLDWVRAYELSIREFEMAAVPAGIMLYVKRFAAYTACRAAKAALAAGDRSSHYKAAGTMKRYQTEYESTNMAHPERISEFRRIMEWGT